MTQIEIMLAHVIPMLANWVSSPGKPGEIRRLTFTVDTSLHLAVEVENGGYIQLKRIELLPGHAIDSVIELLDQFKVRV